MAENEAAEAAPEKKKSKKLLILIIAAVLLVGAGVGGFLMFRGGGSDKPAAAPEPEPGAVVRMTDPITVNLADGHFLKLQFALQATATAAEEPDPNKAIDLAITQYSGMSLAVLSTPKGREQAKDDLVGALKKAYKGDVMDVYLTTFVTQ
jgi:flagellar FliL protein